MKGTDLVNLIIPGEQIVRNYKVGRNEPCPCGSGKKWKHCDCEEYHSKEYKIIKQHINNHKKH